MLHGFPNRRSTEPRGRSPRRVVTALLGLLLLLGSPALGEPDLCVQVVVHPSVGLRDLERRFVADVFLKKRTRWADDSVVKPVDLKANHVLRKHFSEGVLGRSVAAVRRYWQQKIFSGRDLPPPEVSSAAAALEYVSSQPGAIGYVSCQHELKGVRAVTLR